MLRPVPQSGPPGRIRHFVQNSISWGHYLTIHTSEIDFSSRAELKLDNKESSDDKTLETPCQNCGEGKGEAQKTPVGRRGSLEKMD